MQNFNHNTIEKLEAEASKKHCHEELVLQGRMVGTRTGHSLNIQGPHDILMAEVQVITPAGIHTLILQDDNRPLEPSENGTGNTPNPTTCRKGSLRCGNKRAVGKNP